MADKITEPSHEDWAAYWLEQYRVTRKYGTLEQWSRHVASMPPQSLSSGHFSHDQQIADAVDWLRHNARPVYETMLAHFPEWERVEWEEYGSWLDTEAMGVDGEWSSWLCDWIENNTPIYWEEGEPWVGREDEDEEEEES